jgi:hypothetical protein
MVKLIPKDGMCLCGSVVVSMEIERTAFDACHCSMCRKWSGGPALTVEVGRNISFKGEEFISTYSSSEWAERGFCNRCGTHIFYRLKNSSYCNISLGLLENADHFKFQTQIFIDSKPGNYAFANQTELLTEAEVIAKSTQV